MSINYWSFYIFCHFDIIFYIVLYDNNKGVVLIVICIFSNSFLYSFVSVFSRFVNVVVECKIDLYILYKKSGVMQSVFYIYMTGSDFI